MKDVLLGTAAGCLATAPMTMAMDKLHDRLPRSERYPLPPRQITVSLAEKAGVQKSLEEGALDDLTLLGHFGYGAAMGALYGAVGRHLPLPAPLAGITFGLAVWAGSYLGVLPALGLLTPATRHPPRRTGIMIAAHVVWGLTTAALTAALRSREENEA